LRVNNHRVAARDRIIPEVQARFREMTQSELMDRLDASGLPFAPIARPEDLLDDPHLAESGGLLNMTLPGGVDVRLPALPVELDGHRFGVRRDPPASGEHADEVLLEAGLSSDEIEALVDAGVVSRGEDEGS
jgi:crotonobetainyl-CoA:carnitine CoA-transferase CaiB-like acyl-CoA transferase